MFGKLLRSAPNELGYRSVLGRTWIDKITIGIYIYLLESIISIEELNSRTIPLRITQYDTLSLGSLWGRRNR